MGAGLLNKRFWASLCNPVCDWAGLLLLLIRSKKSISGSDAGLAEVERRSSRGRAEVERRSSTGRAQVEQRSSRGPRSGNWSSLLPRLEVVLLEAVSVDRRPGSLIVAVCVWF